MGRAVTFTNTSYAYESKSTKIATANQNVEELSLRLLARQKTRERHRDVEENIYFPSFCFAQAGVAMHKLTGKSGRGGNVIMCLR